MKLSIDLEKEEGDYERQMSMADLLRETIKTEVTAIVRTEVRRQMKTKEKEVKEMVAQVANKDWRQLAQMLLTMDKKG